MTQTTTMLRSMASDTDSCFLDAFAETGAEVTDGARKFFFEQRKRSAEETSQQVSAWNAQRNANKLKFREDAAQRRDTSRKMENSARLSRKQLAEKKAAQAAELREKKKAVQKAYHAQLEEHASLVKSVVNASVDHKFATPSNSRRMLQHPHYQEVTAVLTDVTSSISKEIAASPRRNRPAIAAKSSGAPRSQSAGALKG